jgi:hypothetical protein
MHDPSFNHRRERFTIEGNSFFTQQYGAEFHISLLPSTARAELKQL